MHTLYWYLRPFGASVLLAAYDEAPELYMIEPSGVCYVSRNPLLRSISICLLRDAPAALARACLPLPAVMSLRPRTSASPLLCRCLLSTQRYFGVAIGKNRAPIKTELEKFRTREIMEKKTLTCREAVFELAKMCVGWFVPIAALALTDACVRCICLSALSCLSSRSWLCGRVGLIAGSTICTTRPRTSSLSWK